MCLCFISLVSTSSPADFDVDEGNGDEETQDARRSTGKGDDTAVVPRPAGGWKGKRRDGENCDIFVPFSMAMVCGENEKDRN